MFLHDTLRHVNINLTSRGSQCLGTTAILEGPRFANVSYIVLVPVYGFACVKCLNVDEGIT